MHILMLTSSFPRFDGDYFGPWVLEYSKELIRQGHRVTVVAPQSEYFTGPFKELGGVDVVYFSYFWKSGQKLVAPPGLLPNLKKNPLLFFTIPFLLRGYYKAVERIIRESDIDILHSQWAIPSGYINSLLARKYGIPHVVSTLGAELYLPKRHPFRSVASRVLSSCDVMFAVSEQMKVRALAMGVEDAKIVLLPNTVDPARFEDVEKGHLRSKLNLEENQKIILTVRRLVPEKRVEDLIHAFHQLDEQDVHLVIGGDGPLKAELESLVSQLGLNEKVSFLGYVNSSDLPAMYADATIYVLSSEQEGLSISLLEAMTSGCLVISTSGTGSEDAIQHAENGFLYTPADIADLTRLLKYCLSLEGESRQSLIQAARNTVRLNFSNERVIKEWVARYQAIRTNLS